MTYTEFFTKAFELVITDDENTGFVFLEPHYKKWLVENELTPDLVTDFDVTWEDVREILELEVKKTNALYDNTRAVVDWLHLAINSVIDPAMTEQENELLKNVTEYMKLNASLKDREKDIEKKEKVLEDKSNIVQFAPGMNFSKRK